MHAVINAAVGVFGVCMCGGELRFVALLGSAPTAYVRALSTRGFVAEESMHYWGPCYIYSVYVW